MTDLCIQVHPHRSPELDIPALISECERLAGENRLISSFWWQDGFERYAYVNLVFETDYPKLLWHLVNERLYLVSAFSPLIRAASIVTCQGRFGWDDHLLLHHYDADQPCDKLP